MPQGLPTSKLLNVLVNLSPLAAAGLNFNTLLVMGDSNVINTNDRIRSYGSLSAVANDFGTSAPEYLAAAIFFSQIPQPAQLYIGRWAHSATPGQLISGPLTTAEQVLTTWNTITNASFAIAVDGGAATNVTALNLSSATNMSTVASLIQTAVRALGGAFASVSVTWNSNSNQFVFTSGTTGTGSVVSPLTAAGTGTDISAQLEATSALMQESVHGSAAETALAAVQAADGLSTQWYGLMFATPDIADSDHLAIAQYVEAAGVTSGNPHLYGITTSESAALASSDTTSIGYQLKQLGYERTFVQWSNTNYAVAAMFGTMFTVNFQLANSTITLQWENEVTVIAENLNSSQAAALDANNYNYFVAFNNNTSIIVNGKMIGGFFVDEVWGTDWQASQIATDLWNTFISNPKIAQTNAGTHVLATTIAHSLAAGVNNDLIGEGLAWNFAGFGTLNTGDILPNGYYIFVPDINTQDIADRQARKSVPIQIAINLAGAIHSATITVNVNR